MNDDVGFTPALSVAEGIDDWKKTNSVAAAVVERRLVSGVEPSRNQLVEARSSRKQQTTLAMSVVEGNKKRPKQSPRPFSFLKSVKNILHHYDAFGNNLTIDF